MGFNSGLKELISANSSDYNVNSNDRMTEAESLREAEEQRVKEERKECRNRRN
jgi:hypothetical protein